MARDGFHAHPKPGAQYPQQCPQRNGAQTLMDRRQRPCGIALSGILAGLIRQHKVRKTISHFRKQIRMSQLQTQMQKALSSCSSIYNGKTKCGKTYPRPVILYWRSGTVLYIPNGGGRGSWQFCVRRPSKLLFTEFYQLNQLIFYTYISVSVSYDKYIIRFQWTVGKKGYLFFKANSTDNRRRRTSLGSDIGIRG